MRWPRLEQLPSPGSARWGHADAEVVEAVAAVGGWRAAGRAGAEGRSGLAAPRHVDGAETGSAPAPRPRAGRSQGKSCARASLRSVHPHCATDSCHPMARGYAGSTVTKLVCSMAIATATSLDVHVGGKLLFGDVSFKLEPGDRMTLSGRNGAGKSTLLRVLSGELTPGVGLADDPARRPGRPPRPAPAARLHRSRSATTSSPAAATCSRPRPSWSGWRARCRAAPRRRRWPPTRPPSSGSKPAAATAGATKCWKCCAASASAPSTPSASSRPSPAAS